MRLGQKTGYDYALFLHAEDQVASSGRIALGVLGLAGCFVGFCAPNVGGAAASSIMPRWSTSRPARWCGSTSSQAGSQVPGIKFGDLRTPQGAAQMVERLLGRMKPGQRGPPARRRRNALMCMRCLELSRRSLLVGGGAAAAALHTGVAQARIRPQDMVPLIGAGLQARPTRDEKGLWKEMERVEEEIAGSNLLIKDPKLTGYLQNLIGTVGGPAAKDFRIYLARIPDFNAMMFPTGFAVVFSGPAPADAQRGAAGRRDRARIRPLPAPPHDPLVARPAAQDRHFRDRRDGRRGRRRRRRASISAIMSSSPSSAPSCRCSSTAARWRPRPTPWAPG